MQPAFQLGPFDLLEPIASGAMATVWKAWHRTALVDTAVKVVRSEDPMLSHFMRDEVRAVAQLAHEHIVWIHDTGEVSDEASAASDGALVQGSPWYAMELAEPDTLSRRLQRDAGDWPGCRRILLALLSALGHAHARGFLHRDVKPANVLFGGARPGVKLADFGIALALQGKEQGVVAGTPRYMAPEVIVGRTGDIGPASDLYSLGCVAWWMVTGRPLFNGTPEVLFDAHLGKTPPALEPRMAVPEPLEGWLRQLLAKDARDRFPLAADAAHSLRSLDAAPMTTASGARHVAVVFEGSTTASTDLDTLEPQSVAWADLQLDEVDITEPAESVSQGPPPDPTAWRHEPVVPLATLVGSGLDLLGERDLPVVGREQERQHLWEALLTVHRTGQPEGCLLVGAPGVGKDHLGLWLLRRAEEEGLADRLAVLEASDTPHEALARLAGAVGLAAPERERMLVRGFGIGLGGRIAAGLERGDSTPLRELLERQQRPALLLVRDLDRAPELRELVEDLLGGDAPLLVIGTARTPVAGPWQTLPVGPLPPQDLVQVLPRLAPLSSPTTELLLSRCQGRPGFARLLLVDWARRGLLAPMRRGVLGLVQRPESIPQSLGELWSGRLAEVRATHSDHDVTLQLGALMGGEVRLENWRRACEVLEQPAPDALAAHLVRVGLMARGAGLRWVHPLVRDVVLDGIPDRVPLHRACAVALADEAATSVPLGIHRLESGQLEAGIGNLSRAFFDRRVGFGGRDRSLEVLERCEEALRRHPLDPWQVLLIHEMRIVSMVDDADSGPEQLVAAAEEALRVEARARATSTQRVRIWPPFNIRLRMAMALALLGRHVEARDRLAEARSAAVESAVRKELLVGMEAEWSMAVHSLILPLAALELHWRQVRARDHLDEVWLESVDRDMRLAVLWHSGPEALASHPVSAIEVPRLEDPFRRFEVNWSSLRQEMVSALVTGDLEALEREARALGELVHGHNRQHRADARAQALMARWLCDELDLVDGRTRAELQSLASPRHGDRTRRVAAALLAVDAEQPGPLVELATRRVMDPVGTALVLVGLRRAGHLDARLERRLRAMLPQRGRALA